MSISDKEKKILIEKAKFLVDKDYKMQVDEYTIIFVNNVHKIYIGYPPMSTMSEVGIRFIKENDYFPLDWIAAVRDNLIINCNDKLNGAIQLLKYLEKNYEKIKNYEYCVESEKLISEYIKQLKKI
jgi:hypothetical protein